MSDPPTLNITESSPATSYSVLCKGCKSTLPLSLFLHPVDGSCYRLRMQCKRCINKSSKHWRTHREDIKAARATREHDAERITCVCGVSINVRHRTKHCLSKRHLSVVAVLREHNALPSNASVSIGPTSATAVAERKKPLREEVESQILAYQQRLAANDAVRERRSSLFASLKSPTQHFTTTALVAETIQPEVTSNVDGDRIPPTEPVSSRGDHSKYAEHGDNDDENTAMPLSIVQAANVDNDSKAAGLNGYKLSLHKVL